jgi:hypothetical protein
VSIFDTFLKSFVSVHSLQSLLHGVSGAGAMLGRALVGHLEKKYGPLTPEQLRGLATAARDIADELDKTAQSREPPS